MRAVELKSSSKFCPFCGEKVANDASTSRAGKGATKYLSFQKYAAKKSEERSAHFRSSNSKRRGQKKKEGDPFALINIGVMRFVGPNVTAPIRSKTLPLKVRKDCGYAEVFTEALVRRQAHDQAFDSRTSWKLVYPDGQLAMNLPGQQEEEFTLRNYKEDLGKPYNRITLYFTQRNRKTSLCWTVKLRPNLILRVLGKIPSHPQLLMPLSFLGP